MDSFLAQARPTYFLGVAQEKAFTPGVRKSSQILLAPPSATLSRALPALASFFFFPRYFLSSFLSSSLRPVAAAAGFLRGATRLASKGWFCWERKVLPASAGASLLLSPGASLSLGCARRPLLVRFPGGASRAPGKFSPLQG